MSLKGFSLCLLLCTSALCLTVPVVHSRLHRKAGDGMARACSGTRCTRGAVQDTRGPSCLDWGHIPTALFLGFPESLLLWIWVWHGMGALGRGHGQFFPVWEGGWFGPRGWGGADRSTPPHG